MKVYAVTNLRFLILFVLFWVSTTGVADTIDVLAFYTPNARLDLKLTPTGMRYAINKAINDINITYQNSELTPCVRLLHSHEINYLEAADTAQL